MGTSGDADGPAPERAGGDEVGSEIKRLARRLPAGVTAGSRGSEGVGDVLAWLRRGDGVDDRPDRVR